jgi:UDP-sugar diphosphatase
MKILKTEENTSPQYIKTKKVTVEKDGKEIQWEVADTHNAVSILVNNIETKELIFVQQVRIPVYLHDDSQNGVTTELCAGLVDKDGLSLKEIAIEEMEEEIGYTTTQDNMKKIKTVKSGVGSTGANITTFYTEITDSDKISEGGGTESEDIKILRLPYDQIEDFFYKEDFHTDSNAMFMITWFLLKKEREM